MDRIAQMLVLSVLATCLPAVTAHAHQPVLNTGRDYPADAPYRIAYPEVSKAIFAELHGAPHYYRIDSDGQFDMYVGMTTALVEGCALTSFSFDILDANMTPVHRADGSEFVWSEWYEPFGRDWYWVGPEFGADFKSTTRFEAGTWYIRVHNADNRGRYVLAIGDRERFPPAVILRTLLTLPRIKAMFWNPDSCR